MSLFSGFTSPPKKGFLGRKEEQPKVEKAVVGPSTYLGYQISTNFTISCNEPISTPACLRFILRKSYEKFCGNPQDRAFVSLLWVLSGCTTALEDKPGPPYSYSGGVRGPFKVQFADNSKPASEDLVQTLKYDFKYGSLLGRVSGKVCFTEIDKEDCKDLSELVKQIDKTQLCEVKPKYVLEDFRVELKIERGVSTIGKNQS